MIDHLTTLISVAIVATWAALTLYGLSGVSSLLPAHTFAPSVFILPTEGAGKE